MTTGESGELPTAVRAFTGAQKLLPTPVSPRVAITDVSIYCPDRAGEALLPPPLISLAFPPPFISFGFSPLIKLLACRNV